MNLLLRVVILMGEILAEQQKQTALLQGILATVEPPPATKLVLVLGGKTQKH